MKTYPAPRIKTHGCVALKIPHNVTDKRILCGNTYKCEANV